jgi:acyl-CoA reductase-like NAD-dependent aldehyde dehydrogenase
VLNVVHGSHDVVNAILDHPDIAAVSFVGSDKAGRHIYSRAAASGKRVQVGFVGCRPRVVCGRVLINSSSLPYVWT